jgi:hypothetical protein
MTVNEMHLQFKVGVDKTDSLNSANFTPAEIDIYLSDAQEQFIEQRAYGNNFKRESVEESQQRVKNLQSITYNTEIPSANFITNTDNKPNGVFVALPAGYRHALEEEVSVTYLDCNGQSQTTRVPVVALSHDKYAKAVTNPFSKPNLNKVYRLPFGRFGTNNSEHFEIISSPGYTITKYYLRYLKNPAKINLAGRIIPPATIPFGLSNGTDQGELADEAYREIIRMAVRNALGDIESPRTQESMQRLNEIE